MITHAQLLELVHYDPETGLCTSRKATKRLPAGHDLRRNRLLIFRGDSTPTRHTSIYIPDLCLTIVAGRLIWFYMTGEWPSLEVDHKDNDGWNQRWDNFRLATRSQNQANTRRYRSNTSGHKNVFRSHGKIRPWRVTIQKDGRRISKGRFETLEAAIAVADAAAKALHGDFAKVS